MAKRVPGSREEDAWLKHPGFFNICVHKGLAPGLPDIPERGNPTDIPKAARDWPELNFIIYHSCIRNGFFDLDSLQTIHDSEAGLIPLREGVPDISWTTQFAQLVRPFRNVYAEIGTTFAGSVVTFPTVWAHIIGQLLKFMGKERIVFGSDSLWYGGPQWQIEALWRYQIPESIANRWNYPELTRAAKRKILGLNSARLYGLPAAARRYGQGNLGAYATAPELQPGGAVDSMLHGPGYPTPIVPASPLPEDRLSRMKKWVDELAFGRSNTRRGWIRTAV